MNDQELKDKLKRVIGLCKTEEQLSVAAKYASLALTEYRRKFGNDGFLRLAVDTHNHVGFMLGRITAPKG